MDLRKRAVAPCIAFLVCAGGALAAGAADWPAAGERRISFDASWRFQKGDIPGAEQARLRRLRLARARPAARLGDRGTVRPEDQPAPGSAPLLRRRLVSKALRGAGRGPRPLLLARDRRRDGERHGLPERPRARRPPVRLHRLRRRPHAAPQLRRRQRARGAPRSRAGVVPLVPRSRPLPPRLGRRDRPRARGALGHRGHDESRERRRSHRLGAHRAARIASRSPRASCSRPPSSTPRATRSPAGRPTRPCPAPVPSTARSSSSSPSRSAGTSTIPTSTRWSAR